MRTALLTILLIPSLSFAVPKTGKFMALVEQGKDVYADIDTSAGHIYAKLYSKDAPNTVANFVGLSTGEKEWTDPRTGQKVAGKPLYDGTIFHRVIPNFMIQGGDPTGSGMGDPGYKFNDEITSKKFDRPGIFAMANSGPNTNGCQFFITVAPAPWLNGHYSIFGEVIGGQEVADQIVSAPRGPQDRPSSPVTIKHITISDKAPKVTPSSEKAPAGAKTEAKPEAKKK